MISTRTVSLAISSIKFLRHFDELESFHVLKSHYEFAATARPNLIGLASRFFWMRHIIFDHAAVLVVPAMLLASLAHNFADYIEGGIFGVPYGFI